MHSFLSFMLGLMFEIISASWIFLIIVLGSVYKSLKLREGGV